VRRNGDHNHRPGDARWGWQGCPPAQIERILAALVGVAEEVTVRFLWRPNLLDEGDNLVVEIAVAAQPCTIVTHNVRDFQAGELRFPTVFVKRLQEIVQQGRI
jgi:hypothetical protein